MRLTSRLRPCKTSVTTTPANAKGSASPIMRRNSTPAREGEELRKSIQTELSTKIKLGFSALTWDRLSRCHYRSTEGYPYGFLNERVIREPYLRSGVCS